MSISVHKVANQANAKIQQGGQNTIDTARLAGVAYTLDNSATYSVANLAALPPAVDNAGRFIFVESIGAYRYSDGTQWVNDYSSVFRTITTQLFAWGSNSCGILGNGSTLDRCSPVREISSSTNWCLLSKNGNSAVKIDGTIWTWGAATCGRLGDGTTVNKCSPVREISSSTNWCLVDSGGTGTTAAIKTDGSLWSWGAGPFGELGNGVVGDRCSPVREITSSIDWCDLAVGNYHTSAVKTNGSLWSWGVNSGGQLGDGTTVNKCSPIREICNFLDWNNTASGYNSTIAIRTNGTIWGWGFNTLGQLGDGTTVNKCSPVREISSSTNWCFVSSFYSNVRAIKTDGSLWSWGYNNNGQLGIGTTSSRCSPVREISSSTNWCTANAIRGAIKTDGSLWTWGANGLGQLGNNNTGNRCSPVREITSSTNWNSISASYFSTFGLRAITTEGFN